MASTKKSTASRGKKKTVATKAKKSVTAKKSTAKKKATSATKKPGKRVGTMSKKTVAKKATAKKSTSAKVKSKPAAASRKVTPKKKAVKSKPAAASRKVTPKKKATTKAVADVAKKVVSKKTASKKAKAKMPVVKRTSKTTAPRSKDKSVKKSLRASSRSGASQSRVRAKGTSSKVSSKNQVPSETPQASVLKRSAPKTTASASRRAKDKDKNANKSPFSHTDHASIFRAVEARKAAAKAKQARMETTTTKPKRGSSRRLTDKQLASFEEMLLRIRAELLRQIAYLRGASLTRSDEVNPEEDGTDAFERQLALKLAAGEGDSIFEIDEALERIRQKTYGICEDCGCIIPKPRLKALPFARRCVECQSKVEQKPNMTDHRHY